MPDFDKLQELLEKETFPHDFTFKFVGKNTPQFEEGARQLERKYPSLIAGTKRQSTNGKHLSLTYVLKANAPDEIIQVFKAIHQVPDVLIIL